MNPSMRSKPVDKQLRGRQALAMMVPHMGIKPSRTQVMSNGDLLFDDSSIIRAVQPDAQGIRTAYDTDLELQQINELKTEVESAARAVRIGGRTIQTYAAPKGAQKIARVIFRLDP